MTLIPMHRYRVKLVKYVDIECCCEDELNRRLKVPIGFESDIVAIWSISSIDNGKEPLNYFTTKNGKIIHECVKV